MTDHSSQIASSSRRPNSTEVPWERNSGTKRDKALGANEKPEEQKRRYLVRRFWETARCYWSGASSHAAWVLSAAVLALILLEVGASYAMNRWNRGIFDALENKNADAVFALSLLYFVILAVSVGFSVMKVYTRMTLQRHWRRWVTSTLVDRWLKSGRYYQLNLVSGDHQNPEYRIADDVRIATESPIDFVAGILSAFLSAAAFIVVLWTIGGSLTISAGTFRLTIPGFLVVAAITYAVTAVGAAAGAATGGVIGALVGTGLSEEDAHVYAESVRRGGTMVTVRSPDPRDAVVCEIMDKYGPISPAERRAEYAKAGWSKFDPNAKPYLPSDTDLERIRRSYR
jgi:ABC transporter transmembrane region 2